MVDHEDKDNTDRGDGCGNACESFKAGKKLYSSLGYSLCEQNTACGSKRKRRRGNQRRKETTTKKTNEVEDEEMMMMQKNRRGSKTSFSRKKTEKMKKTEKRKKTEKMKKTSKGKEEVPIQTLISCLFPLHLLPAFLLSHTLFPFILCILLYFVPSSLRSFFIVLLRLT